MSASAINTRVKGLERSKNVGQMSVSKGGFWEEFETLRQQECKHLYSRMEGRKPENKFRNRSEQILPFDHTRVVLRDGDPIQPGSDYINANFITNVEDDQSPNSITKTIYIATQGCLPQTVKDFWRMVWQERCRIIVLTTRLVERGRSQCVKYWPDKGEPPRVLESHTGTLTLISREEKEMPDYILRTFELHRDGQKKLEVQQYHFQAWPALDVPQDPGRILDLLQRIYDMRSLVPKLGPVVVQSSLGIGRTGTFIVTDMIINTIREQGLDCEIDIQKMIQMVRTQRPGMVETEAQYKFVYTVVMHYVETSVQRMRAEQMSQRAGKEYANLSGNLREGLSKWSVQEGEYEQLRFPTSGAGRGAVEMQPVEGEYEKLHYSTSQPTGGANEMQCGEGEYEEVDNYTSQPEEGALKMPLSRGGPYAVLQQRSNTTARRPYPPRVPTEDPAAIYQNIGLPTGPSNTKKP